MASAASQKDGIQRCYACLDTSAEVKLERTLGEYKLFRCSNCGFRFWYPFVQAPREYFEVNYSSHSDITSRPPLEFRHKFFLENIPIKKGSKTLDIGCGDKPLVYELSRRGFDAWGVDFNRGAIEKSKKIYGIKNLYPLSIFEFSKLPNLPKFDLASFFEVLEHVEEPERFIKDVGELLKDDGYVALSIPDSTVFGPWEYAHNVPPYHTAYWRKTALVAFLESHGFKVELVKKIGRLNGSAIVANVLMKLGLMKWPQSQVGTSMAGVKNNYVAKRNFFVRRVAKLLLSFLVYPVSMVLYIFGYRPVIFAIARKTG